MEAKDGVYTGFVISDERDILELKNRIKYYKPISPNDIAFLHHKLEKKGDEDLILLFERLIMNKINLINEAVVHARDLMLEDKKITYGDYVCISESVFRVHKSVLGKIPGEYTVHMYSNGKFKFANNGLRVLLKKIEDYSEAFLYRKSDNWLKTNIRLEEFFDFKIRLDWYNFVFNEEKQIYELSDGAVKYRPLCRSNLEQQYLDYIGSIRKIPPACKNKFRAKRLCSVYVDKVNSEFCASLTDYIRKYIYYTKEDVEVIDWYTNNYNNPVILMRFATFPNDFMRLDVVDVINVPSIDYSTRFWGEINGVPKGKLYVFSKEALQDIEYTLAGIKDNPYYEFLSANVQSLRCKKRMCFEKDSIFGGAVRKDDGKYSYWVSNPLLDISDGRYEIAHPRITSFSCLLECLSVDKVLYFRDLNYHKSKERTCEPIECYLMVNDNNVILYELDASKSTYYFKVEKNCMEKAIFLIWSYFSSHIYNRREFKWIRIRNLFSHFGIVKFNNHLPSLSEDKEGRYDFELPECFYNYD